MPRRVSGLGMPPKRSYSQLSERLLKEEHSARWPELSPAIINYHGHKGKRLRCRHRTATLGHQYTLRGPAESSHPLGLLRRESACHLWQTTRNSFPSTSCCLLYHLKSDSSCRRVSQRSAVFTVPDLQYPRTCTEPAISLQCPLRPIKMAGGIAELCIHSVRTRRD